jgi:hypothetical protein
MSGVVRRPSLPLTEQDERDLAMLREASEYREALTRISGEEFDERTSEGVLLHAVFEAGLQCVRESAERSGYAALAADEREQVERRAIARRRAPARSGDA